MEKMFEATIAINEVVCLNIEVFNTKLVENFTIISEITFEEYFLFEFVDALFVIKNKAITVPFLDSS